MGKSLIEQEWYLLGQPWCHSEQSGMDILAGDEDPHRGTYLFSTEILEDDTCDEEESKDLAREIAEHIIDVHNRSLDEANRPTNCWLDKLRAEQKRVESLTESLQRATELNETLKREAQIHAMEARTANATIGELYQVLTGATGEPGNWNGADPARKVMEQLQRARREAWNEAITACMDECSKPARRPSPDNINAVGARNCNEIRDALFALFMPPPETPNAT